MKTRQILMALVLLILATLACNRTVPTTTPQAETPVPTTTTGVDSSTPESGELLPSASPTLAAGTLTPATSAPTPGTPECTYNADFVTDVTIPDDTEFEPKTAFAKTWRIHNNGECPWEPGTLWVFDSGEPMGGPESVEVPATEPGDTVDITADLVAPDEPGTYTGYWRLRRPNGEAIGAPVFVRIAVTSGLGTPTPGATPTPSGQPGIGPVIHTFRSDVDEADPGDTIALEWETEGASSATLYHLMPTGQLGSFWEVDVNGTHDYEIDTSERNQSGFLLVVSDDDENTTQASHSITLRCPDSWFFEPAPDGCPASAAIISAGAEQPFEHGVMIWAEDEDTIYVFFDDGHSPWWRVYGDEWVPGEPESDPTITPPDGFHQPVRGFGLVWRERLGVRDRLGWAVAAEEAFDTALQRTSRAKYNDTFIRALDGQVYKLLPESSGWEKMP